MFEEWDRIPMFKRIGPKFSFLKRKGQNSEFYKNRTRTLMFEKIGKEIQYLKKWVIIPMFIKIRPEIQCSAIIPVFERTELEFQRLKG